MYFLGLFELLCLLFKQSNAFKAYILLPHMFSQFVTLTRVRVTYFAHSHFILLYAIFLLFLVMALFVIGQETKTYLILSNGHINTNSKVIIVIDIIIIIIFIIITIFFFRQKSLSI